MQEKGKETIENNNNNNRERRKEKRKQRKKEKEQKKESIHTLSSNTIVSILKHAVTFRLIL